MANIGSSIASQLPQKPGTAREDAILDLVRSGNVVVQWVPLTVDVGGVRATFQVTAEPLMLGSSSADGFYPGVTASTLQKIADFYDATLLTPKLVDEIWRQAQVRVDPFIGMANSEASVRTMADTSTFVRHTDAIRAKIPSGVGSGKLLANIGKYWVVSAWTSRRLGIKGAPSIPSSENYGFFSSAPGVVRSVARLPGVNVVQTPGHAHDYNHSDYSQVVMLVKRDVTVCEPAAVSGLGGCWQGSGCDAPGGPGRTRCLDIYDLANDPELAKLVSHEGTINMRLPGVPYVGSRTPPEPGPIGRGAGGPVTPPGPSTPVSSPPKQTPTSPPKTPKETPVPSPKGGVPRRTKQGERGADVVAWQKYLISQGFDLAPYGADGDHGQKTEQASLEWEKRQGKGSSVAVASLFGSRGGMPDKGLALVVAAAGASVGWLVWDMMEKKK